MMTNTIHTPTRYHAVMGFLMATLSLSAQSHVLDGVEISGALGGSWYHTDDSTIQVTVDERDANKVASSTSSMLYSAGIGRHVFIDDLQTNTFITGLLMQANYYYGTTTVKGDVWGYESPNVNNYTFRAPMSSSRLMLDFKPELFAYQGFVPYGVFGVGASWNSMSYRETPINSEVDPSSAASLHNHSSVTVAYDLGAGISKQLTPKLNVSLEYLYASLGQISPSTNSSTPQFIVGAPRFSIASQSVLMRLSWKIDTENTPLMK